MINRVAAASRSLIGAPNGTLVVVETPSGPRFPNGVVADGPVQLPLTAQRWWDPRCRVDGLDPVLVDRFVADTDPLPLPGPPEACIGWGPGLTPAADDVVVGMMIGFHAMGASPRARALAESCSGADTVPFSRALLDHAADGEAVRPLLNLVEALAGRGDVDRAVSALRHFGASSGTHLIDGVRRAALQAAGPPDPAEPATDGAAPDQRAPKEVLL